MLTKLKVVQFRNYNCCEFNFFPKLNIFQGSNGQGKTNVLEAVYYLSLLRSFRSNKIAYLREWEKNSFYITGYYQEKDGFQTKLSVSYGDKRKLEINDTVTQKASNFINHFVCAAFTSEDINIIKGTAGSRRHFLDIVLSQCSDMYLHTLQQYMIALKSRNIMLKNPEKYTQNTLTAYDHMLVQTGIEIELQRYEFVKILNEKLLYQSKLFMKEEHKLSLKYLFGTSMMLQERKENRAFLVDMYSETLKKSFQGDCKRGNTRYGPHRSELSCLLNDNFLCYYGSEGECRMAALAIKFGCIDIMQEKLGDHKITLIIDEIFGELDSKKQGVFLNQIQKYGQVLLACTTIPNELSGSKKIFTIESGKIVHEIIE